MTGRPRTALRCSILYIQQAKANGACFFAPLVTRRLATLWPPPPHPLVYPSRQA